MVNNSDEDELKSTNSSSPKCTNNTQGKPKILHSQTVDPRIISLIDGFVRKYYNTSKNISVFIDIIVLIRTFYYDPNILYPKPMDVDNIKDCNLSSSDESLQNIDSNDCKNNKDITKGIDPSELLIFGYIRNESFTFNLFNLFSIEIIELICDFYQRMNGTSFVWSITNNKNVLNKMLNSNTSYKGFESDVFEIRPIIHSDGEQNKTDNRLSTNKVSFISNRHHFELNNLSLKWYLKLYPNGPNQESRNQFDLEIILVSLPSILVNILFIYQIYCHQTVMCFVILYTNMLEIHLFIFVQLYNISCVYKKEIILERTDFI